ncbi:MAG: 3-oxoacyl-[acyl-carrier protein] reductase, partial [uncultured Blastococcus sp.]
GTARQQDGSGHRGDLRDRAGGGPAVRRGGRARVRDRTPQGRARRGRRLDRPRGRGRAGRRQRPGRPRPAGRGDPGHRTRTGRGVRQRRRWRVRRARRDQPRALRGHLRPQRPRHPVHRAEDAAAAPGRCLDRPGRFDGHPARDARLRRLRGLQGGDPLLRQDLGDRARRPGDPGERPRPGRHRDPRPGGAGPGRRGGAADAARHGRRYPAPASGPAGGDRQRRAVPGLGPEQLHDRQRAGAGRRPGPGL